MVKKLVTTHHELADDSTNSFLKWGKLLTRVTAISATITGAVSAFFSSSSVTGGVALTAAGASTLAAAEKLPDGGYVKTKHIPPTVSQRYEQIAREKAEKLKAADKTRFEKLKQKLKPEAIKNGQGKKATAKPEKIKKLLVSDILPKAEKIAAAPKAPRREQHIFRTRASYETAQNHNLSLSEIDDTAF